MRVKRKVRNLVVVFGDQLNTDSAVFDRFDSGKDLVWMAEAHEEATQVWSNRNRIAFFFSAMRHFAATLEKSGRQVEYHRLRSGKYSLGQLLFKDIERLSPDRVLCALPGEWRVRETLRKTCLEAGVDLKILPDRHFMDTPESFREWAEGRKSVRLEYYYREMRKRHGILMTEDGQPKGGEWNFDKENRDSFDKKGDGPDPPDPPDFRPDETTREVIGLVERNFKEHPGDLGSFAWPVTRRDALKALDDFTGNRLPLFGKYQDALWMDEPFLYHSLLASLMNVKLLDPREVIARAVQAYENGTAPLNAVEGFVRQILGWREYVRGIYWWKMPGYLRMNALEATEELPQFYWTADTPYTCLNQALRQTLKYGYAHHIQRLMVTGLYALLLGVKPRALHEWYLAVYIDAVEWVELPNTLGMSQFGDGGLMASKPYVASGKYINRMSNYCRNCPANPDEATGDNACPFTTLYWDFLMRHRKRLAGNHRLSLQFKNVDRLSGAGCQSVRERARKVLADPSGKELFA